MGIHIAMFEYLTCRRVYTEVLWVQGAHKCGDYSVQGPGKCQGNESTWIWQGFPRGVWGHCECVG